MEAQLLLNSTKDTFFYLFFFFTLAMTHILCSYLSLWLLGTMSVKSSTASSHVTSYIDTDRRQESLKGGPGWQGDSNRGVFGGAVGSSHLALDPLRLQQALVDGVLQQLLVVVGHGCVSAASSAVVIGRHLENWWRHLERRQHWLDREREKQQVRGHKHD